MSMSKGRTVAEWWSWGAQRPNSRGNRIQNQPHGGRAAVRDKDVPHKSRLGLKGHPKTVLQWGWSECLELWILDDLRSKGVPLLLRVVLHKGL